jgi:hypothetical protein
MSNASVPVPAPEISTFDISTRVDEVFAEQGFARTNEDGDIVRVKEKVVKRIADVLVNDALAATADERVEKAMAKAVLYLHVFPHAPRPDDEDEIEREVADNIATYVWSMTTPSYDGRVQRELGNRSGSTDLMLCRRKIAGTPTVYVTRADDLIVDDFVLPASEKVVKVADKTRRDMGLAMQRRPTLEGRIKGELVSMAAKTSIALGVTTSAGALGSGE